MGVSVSALGALFRLLIAPVWKQEKLPSFTIFVPTAGRTLPQSVSRMLCQSLQLIHSNSEANFVKFVFTASPRCFWHKFHYKAEEIHCPIEGPCIACKIPWIIPHLCRWSSPSSLQPRPSTLSDMALCGLPLCLSPPTSLTGGIGYTNFIQGFMITRFVGFSKLW